MVPFPSETTRRSLYRRHCAGRYLRARKPKCHSHQTAPPHADHQFSKKSPAPRASFGATRGACPVLPETRFQLAETIGEHSRCLPCHITRNSSWQTRVESIARNPLRHSEPRKHSTCFRERHFPDTEPSPQCLKGDA